MNKLLLLLLVCMPVLASAQPISLFISEFDPDTPGADAAEFVELYSPDGPSTTLTNYFLVFYNGGNNLSYETVDLGAFTTDANGLLVLTQAEYGPDLQNGPDAIALYFNNNIPDGTSPTQVGLLDAVVYSQGNQSRATTLLAGLGETVQFDESFGDFGPTNVSFQRLMIGGAGTSISKTFYVFAPGPGVLNPTSVNVDVTSEVAGVEGQTTDNSDRGWRMLAMPGFSGSSIFDIDDIASLNLVQGVPGGVNPQQYPTAGANILTTASGESTGDPLNSFNPPSSMDEALLPGAGFFWYFYDLATSPAGGGTSFSRDLADPAFSLALDVNPPDPFIDQSEYTLSAAAVRPYVEGGPPVPASTQSRFYLIGNPYAYPYALGGITNAMLTPIQTNVYVWNPELATSLSQGQTINGSYEILTGNNVDPFLGGAIGVFNGMFVELTTDSDAAQTFNLPSGFQRPRAAAGTIAKTASGEARLAFTLEGVTEDGDGVIDVATMVRFLEDAVDGWDVHDGTSISSMNQISTTLSLIGRKGDVRWPQSALSLPLGLNEVKTVVAEFAATNPGTYSISWDTSSFPEGWNVVLRDTQTGAETNLLTTENYEFVSDATVAAARFELVIAPSNVVANEPTADGVMALSAPMPNPASGVTRLILSAGVAQSVHAAVYDALGREVVVLHDGPLSDQKTLTLDTATLAAGVYVIRAQGENGSLSQRLTVTR